MDTKFKVESVNSEKYYCNTCDCYHPVIETIAEFETLKEANDYCESNNLDVLERPLSHSSHWFEDSEATQITGIVPDFKSAFEAQGMDDCYYLAREIEAICTNSSEPAGNFFNRDWKKEIGLADLQWWLDEYQLTLSELIDIINPLMP